MSTELEVRVRFATPSDLGRCAEVDATVPRDRLARKLPGEEILVAESAGQIVGYLRLEYLWLKFPFVGLIHVDATCRRVGVGRAMLAFLEDYLRERGHRVLFSSSMAEAIQAQGWHRRMGFEECGFLAGVNHGAVGEVFFRKALQ